MTWHWQPLVKTELNCLVAILVVHLTMLNLTINYLGIDEVNFTPAYKYSGSLSAISLNCLISHG